MDKQKIEGEGRAVGFFEDFVERDAIAWDCTRLRYEMSGYESWMDGGWLLFARLEFVQSMGKRDVLV